MAEDNNSRQAKESGVFEAERKHDRSSRLRDQRGAARVKDKQSEEVRLPTPPPDPQCPPIPRDRSGLTSRGPEEEEEDLAAYLNELGASPFEGHSFDYDTTPNSATSAMGGDAVPFTEEAFEHLDRLCALTEQILELRSRSSKFFRRVRGLERAKVQKNADRRLEIAFANDEELLLNDLPDEDTGFAESLLDAMLSNCRDAALMPRRSERSSVRSPSSSRQRSRSLAFTEQNLGSNLVEKTIEADKQTARDTNHNGGPKISKWTRVKAAFKWERACTNDLADIAELNTSVTASSTPTTRFLRIPDAITAGSWSTGSALSPCTSEISSPSTPIGRVSPASSSNEEVFDDSRKNIINYPDRQSPLAKEERKKDDPDRYSRSLYRDTSTERTDFIESSSETNRSKPLIRIISDADATMHVANAGGKDPEVSPKRPTPTLTITIPSNEEEFRSLSSPESMSPLPSSAQDSGGSSPQRPKMRQDISSLKEFKRQHSTIEEAVMPTPKIQRQDSKWNKVRRAFLTNATFSVPPSPVRVVGAQSFANDDTRRTRSCSESVEDLGKTVAGTNSGNNHRRVEVRRDYQALREKFGAEFHRKLIEWERLKSARNSRDGLPLNEERLAPEFRKKLQDWKRAKKGRRSSAAIEQQCVNRRRLTDWQLWRSSSSKPESRFYGKNQNSIGSRGSCASIGSAGSFGSDGKQHLCEDFIKRMEAWRRMSEVACRSNERPRSPTNRVASDIDETEFLALEKLLSLFRQRSRREHQESDAKQLNDCFDGDSRFTTASRGVNCGNEVLIRTSVGSYRFEGISREFTRKLYDWEKYRGISPRSSTFRLLGPGYTPFSQDSDEATLTETPSTTGKNRAFHWNLKRSKSDGSVFEGNLRDESFTLHRSTSLQSLSSTNKLEDDTRMHALPASNKLQRIKDPSEDTAVEDSEPEAMIVDIEDVIEETASPLAKAQPHQMPVYSVAASETTSIAVPLGTVTSSHEPSPVFLVDAEEDKDCKRWSGRTWISSKADSSEHSLSPEHLSDFPVSEDWREGTTSLDEDKSCWKLWCKESNKEDEGSERWTVKSNRSIRWKRDTSDESGDEANRDSMGHELPLTPIYESESDRKKQDFFESDKAGPMRFTDNFETSSTTCSAKELMVHFWQDLQDARVTVEAQTFWKRMNETGKIVDPPDEPNNEQTSNAEDLQDHEDDKKTERRKIILGTDPCTYQLARTLSSLDCRDSKDTSPKLLNLNSDTPECHGTDIENETSAHYENCSSSELQTDVDQHYEILTFKTDTCDDTIDNRLYEPVNCHEVRSSCYDDRNNCVKENLSLLTLSGMDKPNLLETSRSLLADSTVHTIPITVSRDNEARCLERILINEETLKKIIVPTTSAESGIKSVERIRSRFSSVDRRDEANGDRSDGCSRVSRTTRDNQVMCIKKDGSSSRNVFVKTKRMIFAPFRRSEDRTSSRKERDSLDDGRPPRSSKSKSKSRSASPKLCRQDALLRMSLSLPWPLRPASKESEIPSETESRRSSRGKTEDVITTQEKTSPCEESNVDKKLIDQLTNKETPPIHVNQESIDHSDRNFVDAPINVCSIGTSSTRVSEQPNQSRKTSIEQNQGTCRIRDEVKKSQTQDNGKHGKIKCSQVHFEGMKEMQNEGKCKQKQNNERQEEMKCDQRQEETKQQDENHSKCDVVPSDLMHKLKILSDAAAKRHGRVREVTIMESSVVNNSESRSSRIRRAKESFLSRRGGPFCRSMMDQTETDHEDPWRRSSAGQMSTGIETSRSNEVTVNVLKSEEVEKFPAGNAGNRAEMMTGLDEAASSIENKIDERQDDEREDRAIDVGVRSETLVKSASAGMINVDPDTFGRLVAVDRGCESLPRTIAKRRDSSGPLAKIVSKLRLSRLIRSRNAEGSNMSTISRLCRQSLLIDMRSNSENRRSDEAGNNSAEAAKDRCKDDDDHSDESSKTIHE